MSIEIPNLTLNPDGSFYADKDNDSSLLENKLMIKAWFGKFNYDVNLIDGHFIPVTDTNRLELTLESEGCIYRY